MDKFDVYGVGLVCASVCSNLGLEETTKRLNQEHPTGISHGWEFSKNKFRDGSDNPHICERDTDCRHYLFNC